MTNEDLEAHLRAAGYSVEHLAGNDGGTYLDIRSYRIPVGCLAGKICDVALQRTMSVPYVVPPAVHTNPALVPMDTARYGTQASGIGPGWQYWSRVLRGRPSPNAIVAHIATIFGEV